MEYEIIEPGVYIHDYDRVVIRCDNKNIQLGDKAITSKPATIWFYPIDDNRNNITISTQLFCNDIDTSKHVKGEIMFKCVQCTYLVYFPPAVGDIKGVMAKIRFKSGYAMNYTALKALVLDQVYIDLKKITAGM
jgi:hypothetical protein